MPTVIAAPVWARTGDEAALLYRSIVLLADTGLPVLLADGGSNEEFLAAIRALPHVTVHPYEGQTPRLTWQVQTCLVAARETGASSILYTEPDKEWFFRNKLASFLTYAPRDPKVGVVVASRSPDSFRTFPGYQQATETALNQVCGVTLGHAGDFTYGPMLLNPSLLPYLTAQQEDLGWGWRLFLLVTAHRLHLTVEIMEDDFPCPPDQRDEDSARHRLYRLRQLEQNIGGIRAALQLPIELNGEVR